MGVRETADEHEGGHKMALCGYGGEIIAHTSSWRAEVNCPFSQGVWSVTLGVASVTPGSNLCTTLWAQSLLQDLRVADWHMMHVNNLWGNAGRQCRGMFKYCYAERQCLYKDLWLPPSVLCMPPFKVKMQQLFCRDAASRNRSEFISCSDSVQVDTVKLSSCPLTFQTQEILMLFPFHDRCSMCFKRTIYLCVVCARQQVLGWKSKCEQSQEAYRGWQTCTVFTQNVTFVFDQQTLKRGTKGGWPVDSHYTDLHCWTSKGKCWGGKQMLHRQKHTHSFNTQYKLSIWSTVLEQR